MSVRLGVLVALVVFVGLETSAAAFESEHYRYTTTANDPWAYCRDPVPWDGSVIGLYTTGLSSGTALVEEVHDGVFAEAEDVGLVGSDEYGCLPVAAGATHVTVAFTDDVSPLVIAVVEQAPAGPSSSHVICGATTVPLLPDTDSLVVWLTGPLGLHLCPGATYAVAGTMTVTWS